VVWRELDLGFTAYLTLLRPMNCAMMGFAVLIGEFMVLGGLNLEASILGFLTAFMLTGGSMAANDYFDREVDKVNQPTRPIPSGEVSPREALWFAGILGFIGILLSFLSMFLFEAFFAPLLASGSFILALAYNGLGKRFGLLGNLMVSGCVAIPFLYGAFMVGLLPEAILGFFALLALLSNTGREILKGMVDVAGDRLRKVETIAIKYGLKTAAHYASAFYLAAVALSIIPPILGLVSVYYTPPVALADLGFIYTAIAATRKPTGEKAENLKKLSLLWMLLGLIGFILGAVAG
jgi:geranylgeranylglycerol-phosphate geranylgeranyltransferase